MDNNIKRIDFTVTGFEEELKEFYYLLRTIQTLCNIGASRNINIKVDGDGSANLSFFIDKKRIKNIKWDEEKEDELLQLYIGG